MSATTIQRTGDTGQNFAQVAEGDTPNSVELTLGAKGLYQYSLKLYFGSAEEMLAQAPTVLDAMDKAIRERFPTTRTDGGN